MNSPTLANEVGRPAVPKPRGEAERLRPFFAPADFFRIIPKKTFDAARVLRYICPRKDRRETGCELMKTWQAIILNIGLIFGTTYASKIKDPALQNATLAAIAAAAGGAAKINSESDTDGVKLPKQ